MNTKFQEEIRKEFTILKLNDYKNELAVKWYLYNKNNENCDFFFMKSNPYLDTIQWSESLTDNEFTFHSALTTTTVWTF